MSNSIFSGIANRAKTTAFLTRAWRAFRNVVAWQPLTTRGALTLLLSIVALKLYALPQDDLVAYVLGGAAIAALLICTISALLLRLRLGSALKADPRFDSSEALSQRDVPAGIILRESGVPPFFSVSISRVFTNPGVESPTHIVFGSQGHETRHLLDTVRFPHRGIWELSGLSVTLRDALGLTSLSWRLECPASIEVSPPLIPIRPLPIVAGSARAGDQLQFTRDRSGDPFDIKPYDSSDGISRILWKTYARTGELVVRRPEPAAIPEGEVAIYLVARRNDDTVAGALRGYLEQLERSQITMLFGTDGMHEQTFIVANSAADLLPAINRHVWDPAVGTGQGFGSFLHGLAASGRPVHHVVLFAPDEDGDWYDAIANSASRQMVKLAVVLVPPGIGDPFANLNALRSPFLASLSNQTKNVLAQTPLSRVNALKPLLATKRNRQANAGGLVGRITRGGNEPLLCQSYEL